MNIKELLIIILAYGLLWGVYHFWGYDKTIRKVLSNPENYSPLKVNLCKKLTLFPKALLSFLTALIVPLIVILTGLVVFFILSLFK